MSLDNGWATASLGQIVDILDNRRVPVNADEREKRKGPIPYYGATGQVGWIDDFLFDEELVLLGEDGAPFLDAAKPKAYLITGKSWVNNHAHVLRAKTGILNRFVLHQLNMVDFRQYVSGSTRLKLPQAPMREIQFKIAPGSEQKRIVDEIEKQFTRLDDAAGALKRVRANLKRYRASVLKAACEGRLVPTEAELARKEGRDYEPASELLKRILAERRAKWEADQLQKMIVAGKPPKSDEWKEKYWEPSEPNYSGLPILPSGWTWASIEQLTTRSEGLVTGPFGTLISKADHQNTGIPVCGIPNISESGFVPGNWFHVSDEKANELRRYFILPGDVVVSRSGTVGEACSVDSSVGPMLMSTNLMRLRPVRGNLGRWIVLNFRGNPSIAAQIASLCKGSTRPFLNLEILSQLAVALPPESEQARIFPETEKYDSLIRNLDHALETQLLRATTTRRAILMQAFSGKLVPQDPNDEPASVLLERIRAERARAQTRRENRRESRDASPVNGQRRKHVANQGRVLTLPDPELAEGETKPVRARKR